LAGERGRRSDDRRTTGAVDDGRRRVPAREREVLQGRRRRFPGVLSRLESVVDGAKGGPRMSPSEEKLREAAVRAFLRGYAVRSLMELESFGGPACGSAGAIVRKWPAEGVQ